MSANWIGLSKHRKPETARVLAALGVLAFATVACGSPDSTEPESDTSAKATTLEQLAAVPPAPTASEGDLRVQTDPCIVDDAVISEVGFDPGTRERSPGEIVSNLYSALGCTFTRSEPESIAMTARLTVLSTTTSLAETKSQDATNPVSEEPIDGQSAVTFRPKFPGSCTTAIESSDGTLTVETTEYPRTSAQGTPLPGAPDPCGEIEAIASAIARALR